MLACVAEPAKPVLKTAKSLVQLGVEPAENVAGYWPAPTVAPVPMFSDQSRLILLVLGVRPGGKGYGPNRYPEVGASPGSAAGSVDRNRRASCCR